jgi:hypothetical protein
MQVINKGLSSHYFYRINAYMPMLYFIQPDGANRSLLAILTVVYINTLFMIKALRSFFVFFTKHPICKITLAVLLLFILQSFARAQSVTHNKQPQQKKQMPEDNRAINQLTYTIIPSVQNTFGYVILDNKKAIIRQPSIPGLPGIKGFSKKEDAEKAARLVINKISNHLSPPTISKYELDSLKIKL